MLSLAMLKTQNWALVDDLFIVVVAEITTKIKIYLFYKKYIEVFT